MELVYMLLLGEEGCFHSSNKSAIQIMEFGSDYVIGKTVDLLW